jgi:hypothetical protein
VRHRHTRWIWISLPVLICILAGISLATGTLSSLTIQSPPAPPLPQLEPVYTVHAGIDGEIFPAFANYASLQEPQERRLSTVSVTIANPANRPLRQRITVQLPGWSDPEIQTVLLAPGETRILRFAPSFLPRLYRNHEITAATAVITAENASGAQTFAATVPVRLRAVEDLYWGAQFKYASFIASWVTPHDPRVEDFLTKAKRFAPLHRLPGYETWKNNAAQVNSTYQQARAIYEAMQKLGLSYVKSSMTLGNNRDVSERIRFPGESLDHLSANCIDAVVAYAAVFENLGMDPYVVLVPGHAYLALREASGSDKYLYIDVALTGRASFDTALLSASKGLRNFGSARTRLISISKARAQGIYPMPRFSTADPGSATQSTMASITPGQAAAGASK